jgi:Ala-tRNA(Pro) deacylase
MFYVSEITHEAPAEFENETQRRIYETLAALEIPFDRVKNDFIISMEDCEEVNKKLGATIVKNLFLCNRQQTEFYLYVTRDNKRFKTKYFSKALGVSRLSFAPEEALTEYLGVKIGATNPFSLIYDKDCKVHLAIDEDLMDYKYCACNDATNTAHISILMSDLLEKYLPYTGHEPAIVHVDEDPEE